MSIVGKKPKFKEHQPGHQHVVQTKLMMKGIIFSVYALDIVQLPTISSLNLRFIEYSVSQNGIAT